MRPWAAILLPLLFLVPNSSAVDVSPEYRKFPASFELYTDRFQFMSGSAADRCTIRDCLCRVSKPPFAPDDEWATGSRRHSVYFEEAKAVSTSGSYNRLSKFLKSYGKSATFSVIGYTDDCGSHTYNERLVRGRVSEIRARMSALGYHKTSTVSFRAEASFGHDPASRRVDIIAHTSSRVTTVIDKIQADVYLIDSSGSMWSGWRKWANLVAASFKPGSKIYLSATTGCVPGTRLDLVTPTGGTEIWYSYWKVIDYMKPGQTLAVISDFQSDVPLTRREAEMIERKVSQKKIKVIAVTP